MDTHHRVNNAGRGGHYVECPPGLLVFFQTTREVMVAWGSCFWQSLAQVTAMVHALNLVVSFREHIGEVEWGTAASNRSGKGTHIYIALQRGISRSDNPLSARQWHTNVEIYGTHFPWL